MRSAIEAGMQWFPHIAAFESPLGLFHTDPQRRIEGRKCCRQLSQPQWSVSGELLAGQTLRTAYANLRSSRTHSPSMPSAAPHRRQLIAPFAALASRCCSGRAPSRLSSSFRGRAEVQTGHEPRSLLRSSWQHVQCHASSSRRSPARSEANLSVQGYCERYACAKRGKATG